MGKSVPICVSTLEALRIEFGEFEDCGEVGRYVVPYIYGTDGDNDAKKRS